MSISIYIQKDYCKLCIDQALDEKFKSSITDIINPYGDGHASGKIVDTLSTVPFGEKLLFKKNTLLHPEDSP